MDGIALLDIVFLSHTVVLIFICNYLILYLAKLLIEIVDLVAQILDILHHLVRLLLLLGVLVLSIGELLLLVVLLLSCFLEFVLVLYNQVLQLFDVSLELDHLTVALLIDLVELGDRLLVLVLVINQFVEGLLGIRVTKAQLDLIFMECISVQKLLITLNTDIATSCFIRIVLWIWPRLVLALRAVALGAELAVPYLLRRRNDPTTSVAHDRALSLNLLTSQHLFLIVLWHVLRLILQEVDRILRVEKAAVLAIGPEENLRDVPVHLLVFFLCQLYVLI